MLLKNNLVECYSPNCPWGIKKNPFFYFATSKKQGLSQKVLIKTSLKINYDDRENPSKKQEKTKKKP